MGHIKVIIKDKHTLMLDEDAKKGDLINLSELMHVDLSLIEKSILEGTDSVYKNKEKQIKEQLSLEFDNIKKDIINDYELKNKDLINELNNIKENTKKDLLLVHNNELNKLVNKINELENKLANKDSETNNKVSLLEEKNKGNMKELEFNYNNRINDLLNSNKLLEEKLNNQNENTKLLIDKTKFNLEVEYKKELDIKEEELSNLKRQRSNLNVKGIGEDLEKWCDNEFLSYYSLVPNNNIIWKKDNDVVGGSKGDFTYKVYATDQKKDSELLTSILFEMKSEDPNSINKSTNRSHYKKLDSDRTKKNLEYAILVSELEWDSESSNDVPIRKVDEYEKMYVVRPQYFMTLLNIITAFGLKYKDILLAKEQDKIKFKDTQEILDSFEQMKKEILDNSLKHINTQITDIINQSNNITKANAKILDSANLILERHLVTVENKIKEFKIVKLTNNIGDI